MNISFNISDALGAQFISASRWTFSNREDLTDERICKKFLKRKIGELVDTYNRFLAIGETEQNLLSAKSTAVSASTVLYTLERTFEAAKNQYAASYVPTDAGEEN